MKKLIRPRIQKLIERIAQKRKMPKEEVNDIYEYLINEFQHEAKQYLERDTKIVFIPSKKSLNGFSPHAIRAIIIEINEEYLEKFLFEEEWQIAVTQTIGHEVGHKYHHEPCPKGKFTNWVRECRADYFGINFAAHYYSQKNKSYNDVFSCVKKKAELYVTKKTGDKGNEGHPSWKLRLELMKNYYENNDFGKEIIRKIAQEQTLHYNDSRYIDKISKNAYIENSIFK